MRFIHIADIHIGMRPDMNYRWSEDRGKEIINSLDRVIKECNDKSIDMLLVAGDLFHRQPRIKDLKEVNYIFSKLMNTHVFIIAGNHDYATSTSKYRDFKWNDNVHMLLDKDLESVYLKSANTEVYGFSYNERDIKDHRYEQIQPDNTNRINILLAHGGDSKNIPIDFAEMGKSKFDYIALGHIHKPKIISDNMAYAGSLEPLDKTETGDHGYIYGEIEKGKCNIEFIPFSERKYIKATIIVDSSTTNGKLLDKIDEVVLENGRDNIYIIVVEGMRDPTIEFDCKDICRDYNIMSIEDNSLPDYDFNLLFKENVDNIVGMFINKVTKMDLNDEIKKRTLYLGVEALTKKD